MEDVSCYIIKSYVRGQKNWSGKEFSSEPSKIYFNYQDAFDALAGYWFNNYAPVDAPEDSRVIKIVPLTEKRKQALLKAKAIRL